jgi:hypothetical protein
VVEAERMARQARHHRAGRFGVSKLEPRGKEAASRGIGPDWSPRIEEPRPGRRQLALRRHSRPIHGFRLSRWRDRNDEESGLKRSVAGVGCCRDSDGQSEVSPECRSRARDCASNLLRSS